MRRWSRHSHEYEDAGLKFEAMAARWSGIGRVTETAKGVPLLR